MSDALLALLSGFFYLGEDTLTARIACDTLSARVRALHLLVFLIDLKQLQLGDPNWLKVPHFAFFAHSRIRSIMKLSIQLIDVLNFRNIVDEILLPVLDRSLGL